MQPCSPPFSLLQPRRLMDLNLISLAAVAVLFAATLARATFGFADALVAMPLLSMLDGISIATRFVALTSLTMAIFIVAMDWRHVDFGSVWQLVVAACFGIPLGVYYLQALDSRYVNALLGLLVLSFAIYTLAKPPLGELTGRWWAWPFGFAAGILGGAYNTHGPPLVIYGALRKWPPQRFRATMQAYSVLACLAVICSHALQGLWQPAVFRLYLTALPALLLAMALGTWLNRRLRDRSFGRWLCYLLILLGAMLLISALRSQ